MTTEQIKQFIEEKCSKCNKDINCKITQKNTVLSF